MQLSTSRSVVGGPGSQIGQIGPRTHLDLHVQALLASVFRWHREASTGPRGLLSEPPCATDWPAAGQWLRGAPYAVTDGANGCQRWFKS